MRINKLLKLNKPQLFITQPRRIKTMTIEILEDLFNSSSEGFKDILADIFWEQFSASGGQ